MEILKTIEQLPSWSYIVIPIAVMGIVLLSSQKDEKKSSVRYQVITPYSKEYLDYLRDVNINYFNFLVAREQVNAEITKTKLQNEIEKYKTEMQVKVSEEAMKIAQELSEKELNTQKELTYYYVEAMKELEKEKINLQRQEADTIRQVEQSKTNASMFSSFLSFIGALVGLATGNPLMGAVGAGVGAGIAGGISR